MERFRGRLSDGDRVVFSDISGCFDGGRANPDGCTGLFEVHQGGVLGDHLPTDHPYRLDLEDGRTASIRVTKIRASNSAGIATLEFRLDGPWMSEAAERPIGRPL